MTERERPDLGVVGVDDTTSDVGQDEEISDKEFDAISRRLEARWAGLLERLAR